MMLILSCIHRWHSCLLRHNIPLEGNRGQYYMIMTTLITPIRPLPYQHPPDCRDCRCVKYYPSNALCSVCPNATGEDNYKPFVFCKHATSVHGRATWESRIRGSSPIHGFKYNIVHRDWDKRALLGLSLLLLGSWRRRKQCFAMSGINYNLCWALLRIPFTRSSVWRILSIIGTEIAMLMERTCASSSLPREME